MSLDREQQKLRCAATAAKWRTAYRNRRAVDTANALTRTDLERRAHFNDFLNRAWGRIRTAGDSRPYRLK